ncbi:type III-B CRISPR module-associated protein Cmr3 [Thermococcus barophilus]|uniref:type III-B CRISPR module-associated protein Cmr3 n=1 Tax=Thermococcus barophilus TaxID=55802 RepID=UPI001F179E56|nr:type III-B CRISPR module-associated protein Cmr3 [Thermococcus barophilus]
MKIIPNDVLFFRESRDFTAGESHLAESLLPLPHTIAGALMGVMFVRGRHDLLNLELREGKFWKPEKWKPNFEVVGTFFMKENELYFPLPKDIVSVKSDGRNITTMAKLKEVQIGGQSFTIVFADCESPLHFSPVSGFLSFEKLKSYLNGEYYKKNDISDEIIENSSLYRWECRVGIGLNSSKTTVEGLFYRTRMLRLEKGTAIGVVLGEKNLDEVEKTLGKKGTLKLGGEGRFAHYEIIDEDHLEELEEISVKKNALFKLYLATPLIVDGQSWNIAKVLPEHINAEIVKVFTDRPEKVTGWDLVKGCPKETLYAVPAGSVYILKAQEDLTLKPFYRLGMMVELGYGLVFVGVYG